MAPQGPSPQEADMPQEHQVVVADDDPDIRALVTLKLGALGIEVHEAADGHEALELIREHHPDVALLDLMMPRRTGVDVIREVRADPEIADTLLVLLTARSQDVDVDAGFSSGVDHYIIKPFSPRELVANVMTLLGRGE